MKLKIIHPSNDNLMREVLYDCGFDVKQGIAYIPFPTQGYAKQDCCRVSSGGRATEG